MCNLTVYSDTAISSFDLWFKSMCLFMSGKENTGERSCVQATEN